MLLIRMRSSHWEPKRGCPHDRCLIHERHAISQANDASQSNNISTTASSPKSSSPRRGLLQGWLTFFVPVVAAQPLTINDSIAASTSSACVVAYRRFSLSRSPHRPMMHIQTCLYGRTMINTELTAFSCVRFRRVACAYQ